MFKSTLSLYQYLPVPNQEEISKTKIPRKNILKEGTKLRRQWITSLRGYSVVEMALVLGQNRVGIARSDNPTTVPNHPVARLMFYFDCICTVLQITDEYAARLRDYMNFYLLTESEMDKLLYFCWLFSPDELINKCIFLNDDLCGEYENGFFELSEITERLLVTDSLMIGNQQRRVKKVMAFKAIFLLKNYYIPIEIYKERLHILLLAMNIIMQERRRIAGVEGASETPVRTTNTSSCCIIL